MVCQIEKVNEIVFGNGERSSSHPTVGRIHSVNGKSLTIPQGRLVARKLLTAEAAEEDEGKGENSHNNAD